MRFATRFLAAGTACVLALSATAYALEPALDPLPDLSSYPTRILVDGQAVTQGELPRYVDGQALLPLRSVLENSGCTVDWDPVQKEAVFETGPDHTYTLELDTGVLLEQGETLWTDDALTLDSGRTYVSPALFDYVEGLSVHWDPATNTAVVVTDTPQGNLYCYDLGEGTLDNPTRPDTSYRMQGVLGVPEGEDCPVVILLHGSHPIQQAADNRYDLGFSYLVEALADAGYLALSMNVGINYSFEDGEPMGCERTVQVVEQQSELLARAIGGEQGIFPCDLTGKGDLDNVILVGHSRAGADILTVAERTETLGVRGLVSVAPSMVSPLSDTPPDLPTGILIPQYDGDVTSLDGATLFDRLESAEGRTAPTELIYLYGGNHGGFSTALVRPDPFADQDTLDQVMDPAQQQTFLTEYVLAFAAQVLDDGRTPLSAEETSFAGCDILVRTDSAGQTLYSAAQPTDLETLQASAEPVVAASTLDNTAGAFRLPGSFQHYDLTRIRWEQAGASVSIPVQADLSGSSCLQLDLAQDSSDPLNGQTAQSLTVTLRDAAGHSYEFSVPADTPALAWQEGEIEHIPLWDDEELLQYSTFTPLGSVVLDLTACQDVDLSRIQEIVLTFDRPSGSLMLREIQAY